LIEIENVDILNNMADIRIGLPQISHILANNSIPDGVAGKVIKKLNDRFQGMSDPSLTLPVWDAFNTTTELYHDVSSPHSINQLETITDGFFDIAKN